MKLMQPWYHYGDHGGAGVPHRVEHALLSHITTIIRRTPLPERQRHVPYARFTIEHLSASAGSPRQQQLHRETSSHEIDALLK